MIIEWKKLTSYSLFFSFLVALLCVATVIVKSQESNGIPDDCSKVLVEKNTTLLTSNDYTKVIYLNSIDEETFNKVKQDASATVPGYFDGSWSNFQEERRKLRERTRYESTIEQSRFLLTSVSLPDATDKWLGCIQAKSEASAFFGRIIGNPAGKKFKLRITWKPGYELGLIPIIIINSDVPGLKKDRKISPGTAVFTIERSKPDEEILLSVTGKGGNLARSFEVFIPAYKTPIITRPMPVELGSCIGRGGVQGVTFWGPVGADCNGIKDWGKYLVNTSISAPAKVASCIGKGGLEGVRLWGPEGQACGGIAGWGTYKEQSISTSNLAICGCVGHGNILEGMILWGPKDKACGGMASPEWGFYDQYCVLPK